MQGTLKSTMDKLSRQGGALEALIIATCMEIDKLGVKWICYSLWPSSGYPKAEGVQGLMVAKDVDNFLCSVDNHFRKTRITNNAIEVSTALMYSANVALL